MPTFPFLFGLGFFLRIFVPGLVGGFLLVLFRGQEYWFRDLQSITIFLLFSGVIGMVLRVFYGFAAELLYGEYWPGWLRVWKVKILDRRLRAAEEQLKSPATDFFSSAGWKVFRASRYVQLFPMDNTGKRSVASPTILGNIAATSLARLSIQYGLKYMATRLLDQHITYVLTRLWFLLPHRLRREISESFAETEAMLGSMIAVFLGSIAFAIRGLEKSS